MNMKSPARAVSFRLPMAPDAPDFKESPVPDENEISIPWGDNYFLYWDKSHWTLAFSDGVPWFAIYLPRFATREDLLKAASQGVRERA